MAAIYSRYEEQSSTVYDGAIFDIYANVSVAGTYILVFRPCRRYLILVLYLQHPFTDVFRD
jgi:outer membrane receptor for ferric coprogen and ferric-rhodotorulic acid